MTRKFFLLALAGLLSAATQSCEKLNELFEMVDYEPTEWAWHADDDWDDGDKIAYATTDGSLYIEFGVKIGRDECKGDVHYSQALEEYDRGNTIGGIYILYNGQEYTSRLVSGHAAADDYVRFLSSFDYASDGPYWDDNGKYEGNAYYLDNGITLDLVKTTGYKKMTIKLTGPINLPSVKVEKAALKIP